MHPDLVWQCFSDVRKVTPYQRVCMPAVALGNDQNKASHPKTLLDVDAARSQMPKCSWQCPLPRKHSLASAIGVVNSHFCPEDGVCLQRSPGPQILCTLIQRMVANGCQQQCRVHWRTQSIISTQSWACTFAAASKRLAFKTFPLLQAAGICKATHQIITSSQTAHREPLRAFTIAKLVRMATKLLNFCTACHILEILMCMCLHVHEGFCYL